MTAVQPPRHDPRPPARRRPAPGHPGRHPSAAYRGHPQNRQHTGAYGPPPHPTSPAPSTNGAGITAFVLALLALLVGPVLWAAAGYPSVHGFVVMGAILAAALVLVALPLGCVAYGRVRRGQADARGLTVAALVLVALVPLVLVVEVLASRAAQSSDAAALCSSLSSAGIDTTAIAGAISDASPGLPARLQLERAEQMTDAQCPGESSTVRITGSFIGY